jgi:hypothetical protein
MVENLSTSNIGLSSARDVTAGRRLIWKQIKPPDDRIALAIFFQFFFAWHMTLGSPGNFLITLLFLAIATFLVKLFDRSNDIRLLLNIQALTFWLFLKRAEGQTLKNWTVYTTGGATVRARVGHKRGKRSVCATVLTCHFLKSQGGSWPTP